MVGGVNRTTAGDLVFGELIPETLLLQVASMAIAAGSNGSCPPSSSLAVISSGIVPPSFAPKDMFCVPSNGVPLPLPRALTNVAAPLRLANQAWWAMHYSYSSYQTSVVSMLNVLI